MSKSPIRSLHSRRFPALPWAPARVSLALPGLAAAVLLLLLLGLNRAAVPSVPV